MITLKEINYLEFDGEYCKGTIGKKPNEFVFTKLVGDLKKNIVTSYEGVATAIHILATHHSNTDSALLFGGAVRVPPSKIDGLHKELNTLTNSWHVK